MDRKEAAETLALMMSGYSRIRKNEMEWEALSLAIEALQEPEIVHCKDCRHWDKEIMYCNHTGMQIEPDGYCVYREVEE